MLLDSFVLYEGYTALISHNNHWTVVLCIPSVGARGHPHLYDRYQDDVVIDDRSEESVALGHRLKGVIGIVEVVAELESYQHVLTLHQSSDLCRCKKQRDPGWTSGAQLRTPLRGGEGKECGPSGSATWTITWRQSGLGKDSDSPLRVHVQSIILQSNSRVFCKQESLTTENVPIYLLVRQKKISQILISGKKNPTF